MDDPQDTLPAPTTVGQQQPPLLHDDLPTQSDEEAYEEEVNMNSNNHAGTTMTSVEPGLHTLSSVATAAMSDGGSSSLSELEYNGEDNEDLAVRSIEHDSSEGSDSEAETERLEISPEKIRTVSGTAIGQKSINGDTPTKLTSLRLVSGPSQAAVGRETPSRILSSPGQISISGEGQADNELVRSSSDTAGRKRKRSGSLSDASSMSMSEEDRSSKRSNSNSSEEPAPEILDAPRDDDIAVEEDDDDRSDVLSEISSQSDLTATVEDLPAPLDDPLLDPADALKDDLSDYPSDEPASDHEMLDVPEDVEDAIVKPEEVEELPELDVEEDEGEAAAKSEDESKYNVSSWVKLRTDPQLVAKKKSAMDALLPIEKLFAIFRDQ